MSPPVVEYVQPTRQHVQELAEYLRAADRIELAACGYADPRRAIETSLACSTHMVAALADGRCGAIMGVTPVSMLEGRGSPWMLGTDLVVKYRRALMAQTPAYIRAMLHAYPHLVNYVHADNAVAVRYLRHAGFTLHAPEPYGVHGELFHRFEMRA
jgi:hypothetical protein